MATPALPDARLFYRSAVQRYEDAQILLDANRTTGAIYLAGYGIECILKALVLSALPPASRAAMFDSFRGAKAHSDVWLKAQYMECDGARFPREINEAFTLVQQWTTDLRYLPRTLKKGDATAFLAAAAEIILWADDRI